MQAEIGILDVVAMLALFATGFAMWVAWELIIGRKGAALALAIATFTATWAVAGAIGVRGPIPLLLVQAAVALVIIRVANRARDNDDR